MTILTQMREDNSLDLGISGAEQEMVADASRLLAFCNAHPDGFLRANWSALFAKPLLAPTFLVPMN